jgi:hypothetical protein
MAVTGEGEVKQLKMAASFHPEVTMLRKRRG